VAIVAVAGFALGFGASFGISVTRLAAQVSALAPSPALAADPMLPTQSALLLPVAPDSVPPEPAAAEQAAAQPEPTAEPPAEPSAVPVVRAVTAAPRARALPVVHGKRARIGASSDNPY
jgi:hypothetical protein